MALTDNGHTVSARGHKYFLTFVMKFLTLSALLHASGMPAYCGVQAVRFRGCTPVDTGAKIPFNLPIRLVPFFLLSFLA